MDKMIDCLLIGHNEMDFKEYEKQVRNMGIRSGAYRDLEKNFISFNDENLPVSEVFNLFCCHDNHRIPGDLVKPLNMLETFSASIAYLGTWLNRRGFSFEYVNSFRDSRRELAEWLEKENILTAAIITTLYVSELPILEIVRFIREHNRSARIIIGGPFISTRVRTRNPEELEYLFSSLGADFYINSSQGEETLTRLLHALKHQLPVNDINNIYYKTANGYQATPLVKENNQLSRNMVNWDLFADRVGEYAAVRTAISCPFSCAFCGFPQHAGQYQTAPVEKIEEELNLLDKIKTLRSVHFIDDTFNIPVKRFKDLLRMMVKNNYGFKWHSYLRCQFADREMVELMKESGCEGVFLGIESGCDQILKNMNKAVTAAQYREGIALLKEYHIPTFGCFIVGFPGETNETAEETKTFIETSGLDFYRTQLWYCEPITPIWKEKHRYEISGESFEWSHATMNSSQASDLIDRMFLSIQNVTWVPQYNFDFDNLFHLLHRDMNLEQLKKFLQSFNNGIKEKLLNPSLKEASLGVIRQLQQSCAGEKETADTGEKVDVVDKYSARFDF